MVSSPCFDYSTWDNCWLVNVTFMILSYQHTIVGTRRARRPEKSGGGIIADEMGLGKTITTLSTIVGPLCFAEAFIELLANG